MSLSVNKEIPEGYKQTEVGVIPDDWEVTTLEQAVNFLDGMRKPIKAGERAKIKGQFPYYGASGVVDHINDYIFEGDFILLGEDGENILSRNLPLAFKASGKIWVNNHAHVMTPKDDFHIDFLVEYLESLDYSLLNSGTAQPKLNKQACLNLNVVRPPIQEQTAIANALSDVDALLSELENLIAKKQAIKTATMQQLLTGKTRLPEFATYTEGEKKGQPKGYKPSELGEIPEDWEVMPAKTVVEFMGGYGFSSRLSSGSGVKWLKIANVGLNEIKWDIESYLPRRLILSYKDFSLKVGDIVMALTRPILGDNLKIARVMPPDLPALLNQRVAKLIIKGKNSLSYIFYVVQRAEFIAQMNLDMAGTDPPNIGTNALGNINIILPKPEEQAAIANILSDMDCEIQTLEQRLEKTRQIKQGMMQELLTGRTRLPFDEEA